MSNDENNNINEVENSANTAETVTENSTIESGNETSEKTNNFVANLLALKDDNPKVFFGGIGAVVVLLLIVLMSSGSSKKIPTFKQTPIVVGNEYKLKGANNSAPEATVRLVAVPGSMAAFDDTEESDRTGCKHMPQGTRVKALQTQAAYGKEDAFVQVEILDEGECKGQKGWALGIDLK
jgi:hypothetical protein